MKRTPAWPHVAVALLWLLPLSGVASPSGASSEERRRTEPKVVQVEALPGGRLQLSFEPVAPDESLEMLRLEDARAVLEAFDELLRRERLYGVVFAPSAVVPVPQGGGTPGVGWEQRLRQLYMSRYGPALLPLPQSLEESPLVRVLKRSPRYMGEGVREAARELFNSRVFVASVALSVLVYFAAWVAPEPVFTKAFVAGLTLRLALVVGALELGRFARACVRLYREVEAASTERELEAVAERFGKAMGGAGLRVLVMVASMGVAKGLPQVPKGGLGALLRAPRFALPEGLSMGSATTVQMVADGTIVVTGVAAGTAASAVGSACTDGSESKDGYHWHHLATDKNDISTAHGGPWTPLFRKLFMKAGLNLDVAENLVYLKGHQGPHPEAYHRELYRRLEDALEGCQNVSECRAALKNELKKLASEICTPGSFLHRLVTKT